MDSKVAPEDHLASPSSSISSSGPMPTELANNPRNKHSRIIWPLQDYIHTISSQGSAVIHGFIAAANIHCPIYKIDSNLSAS